MLSSTKKKVAAAAVSAAMLLAGFGTMAAQAHEVPACDNTHGNAPTKNPHCKPHNHPGDPGGPGDTGEGDDNSVVIIDNDLLDLDLLNDVLDIEIGDILTNNGDILTGDILTGDILSGGILSGDVLSNNGDILSGNSLTVVAPVIANDVVDLCTINHDGNGGTGNGPGNTVNDCDVVDLGAGGFVGLRALADVTGFVGLF